MHRTFALVLCLAVAPLFVACGDDNSKTPTAVASASSAASLAPTEVKPTATPALIPNTISPTAVANELPRLLWILRDHAGTGIDTVRFETNVETTAVVSIFGRIGDPAPLPSPTADSTFSKAHAVGQPLGTTPGLIHVEVTDRQGKKGSGDLEMGAVLGRQFFGAAPDVAPKLTFGGNRTATVTWVNLKGGNFQQSVQAFAKKGGCSTAQACQATFEKNFTQDTTGGDATIESHKVAIQFGPDKTQDYQVLITASLAPTGGATQSAALFYQFNVLASDIK